MQQQANHVLIEGKQYRLQFGMAALQALESEWATITGNPQATYMDAFTAIDNGSVRAQLTVTHVGLRYGNHLGGTRYEGNINQLTQQVDDNPYILQRAVEILMEQTVARSKRMQEKKAEAEGTGPTPPETVAPEAKAPQLLKVED